MENCWGNFNQQHPWNHQELLGPAPTPILKFIQVNIGGERTWVKTNGNHKELIRECKQKFPILINISEENIKLSSEDGCVIKAEDFYDYVTFTQEPKFSLSLDCGEDQSGELTLLGSSKRSSVPTTLAETLKKRKFDPEKFKNKILDKHDRSKLIDLSTEYIYDIYGDEPTTEQKIKVARDIVDLFPQYKNLDTPGGYEAMYDPGSGGCGYLGNRIKFVKALKEEEKRKLADAAAKAAGTNGDENSGAHKGDKKTTWEQNEIVEFLENPDQILKTFKDYYPDQFNNLVNKWDTLKHGTLSAFLSLRMKLHNKIKYKDEDVVTLIKLMALLPSVNRVKRGQKKIKLEDSFEHLIVFKKRSTPISEFLQDLKIGDNPKKQPIIVCTGEAEDDPDLTFNVVIDGVLIRESSNCKEAFDLLFKSIFVLDLKYDAALITFFEFVQKYVFYIEANQIKSTPRMIEINNLVLH